MFVIYRVNHYHTSCSSVIVMILTLRPICFWLTFYLTRVVTVIRTVRKLSILINGLSTFTSGEMQLKSNNRFCLLVYTKHFTILTQNTLLCRFIQIRCSYKRYNYLPQMFLFSWKIFLGYYYTSSGHHTICRWWFYTRSLSFRKVYYYE